MAFAFGAFRRERPLPAGDPTPLAALGRLFSLLAFSSSPVLTPREFLETQPAWIRSGRQQDAAEFMKLLFDQTVTAVRCEGGCEGTSYRAEEFTDLSLPFRVEEREVEERPRTPPPAPLFPGPGRVLGTGFLPRQLPRRGSPPAGRGREPDASPPGEVHEIHLEGGEKSDADGTELDPEGAQPGEGEGKAAWNRPVEEDGGEGYTTKEGSDGSGAAVDGSDAGGDARTEVEEQDELAGVQGGEENWEPRTQDFDFQDAVEQLDADDAEAGEGQRGLKGGPQWDVFPLTEDKGMGTQPLPEEPAAEDIVLPDSQEPGGFIRDSQDLAAFIHEDLGAADDGLPGLGRIGLATPDPEVPPLPGIGVPGRFKTPQLEAPQPFSFAKAAAGDAPPLSARFEAAVEPAAAAAAAAPAPMVAPPVRKRKERTFHPTPIQEMLDSVLASERLTEQEGNAYSCDRCGRKTDATRTTYLQRVPSVLIVSANRFEYDLAIGRRKKIACEIEGDWTVLTATVLARDVVKEQAEADKAAGKAGEEDKSGSDGKAAVTSDTLPNAVALTTEDVEMANGEQGGQVADMDVVPETPSAEAAVADAPPAAAPLEFVTVDYDLYAVVFHSGYSADYGHYYAFAVQEGQEPPAAAARTRLKAETARLSWTNFNDSSVRRGMTLDDVLAEASGSDTPYILFYRRRDRPPPAGAVRAPMSRLDLAAVAQHVKAHDMSRPLLGMRGPSSPRVAQVTKRAKMGSDDEDEGGRMGMRDQQQMPRWGS
ncbi:hypothetical protein DFJ74DRAFT_683954 [Hyaloraphidium curvatum]|nr:hypothetical protein DFJ74DRAFT_683954 [Hyaloraphidium curvatum]